MKLIAAALTFLALLTGGAAPIHFDRRPGTVEYSAASQESADDDLSTAETGWGG
jgi:hypothetical protein